MTCPRPPGAGLARLSTISLRVDCLIVKGLGLDNLPVTIDRGAEFRTVGGDGMAAEDLDLDPATAHGPAVIARATVGGAADEAALSRPTQR